MFQKFLCPPKVEHILSLSQSIDAMLLHIFIDFSTAAGHPTQWLIMIQFQCCGLLHVLLFLYKVKHRPSEVWSYIVFQSCNSLQVVLHSLHIKYTIQVIEIHCFRALTHFNGCFTNSQSNTSSVFTTIQGFRSVTCLNCSWNYLRLNALSSKRT